MSFFPSRFPSRADPRPRVSASSAVLAGVIALGGTFFLGVVLLPGIADILAALSEPVAFGAVLLLTTAVRVVAGVIGARRIRRQYGTERRGDAMPSVLVGVGCAWLAYEVLAVFSALGTGQSMALSRIPLEGIRWELEAALGAFVVEPGPAEWLDPALQRFVVRSRRSR
jgi:hypothetical protein